VSSEKFIEHLAIYAKSGSGAMCTGWASRASTRPFIWGHCAATILLQISLLQHNPLRSLFNLSAHMKLEG